MTGTSAAQRTVIRPARPSDAEQCGRICYEAFASIADRHAFPHDFPSVEAATRASTFMISHSRFFGVVGEQDGRVVGSNFLDERSSISVVGPLTVDPSHQDRGVGKELMRVLLKRAAEQQVPGVRLVQAAYHNRSLSLYTKLGFDVREPLVTLHGSAFSFEVAGCTVRPATGADVAACNALCSAVHGHNREGELWDAISARAASVVERHGRITGYTTGISFFGHAVAETNDDLRALIGAATQIEGPGFIVPMRNADMLRWCLARGLRVVHALNLMTTGLYQEPSGAYLSSIGY